MTTLTFDSHEIDSTSLPQASLARLLITGFAHLLGNEVSSSVVARIRNAIINGTERKAKDVSTNEVKLYRQEYVAVVNAWVVAEQKARVEALIAGTIGQRAATTGRTKTPLSPIDRFRYEVAGEQVMVKLAVASKLAANATRPPVGRKFEFIAKDGTKTEYTFGELIFRHLSGESKGVSEADLAYIEKEAKRRHDSWLKAQASEGDAKPGVEDDDF